MRNLSDFHHISVKMSGVRTYWIKILNSNVAESFFKFSLEQWEIHHLGVAVNKYLFESSKGMRRRWCNFYATTIRFHFWDVKTVRNRDNFYLQSTNIVIWRKHPLLPLLFIHIVRNLWVGPLCYDNNSQ